MPPKDIDAALLAAGMRRAMPVQTMSVSEAQDSLIATAAIGQRMACPCCGQNVKIYPYKISKVMLRALAWIAQNPFSPASEFPTWMMRNRNYAMLPHWGLLVKEALTDEGWFWVITPAGLDFLRGKRTVPERVFIFNDTVIEVSAKRISVSDVVEDFDLGELLDPGTVLKTAVRKPEQMDEEAAR